MEENKINTDTIIEEIHDKLTEVLPLSFHKRIVKERFFNGKQYIKIQASPSNYEINKVKGQYPQLVSLLLDVDTFELLPQSFGTIGGQVFYRNIRPDLYPEERNKALGMVKVPFRKPPKKIPAIYKCIERFFQNYLALLKEWKDDLPYKEFGNYNF